MIRKAKMEDIQPIVDIHVRVLPQDLLPRLGRRYLTNQFYRKIIDTDIALTLVNDENGLINAFCVFAYGGQKLTAQITRNKTILGIYLLLSFLRNTSIFHESIAYLKGFHMVLNTNCDLRKIEDLPEIYIIATDPLYQSKGIGKQLINEGVASIFKKYPACVVKTSSDRAKSFYIHNGFEDIGVEYRGERMLYMLVAKAY